MSHLDDLTETTEPPGPSSVVLRDARWNGARPSRPQAVVIGAGPYGLAAAAHFAARGLSVRTLGVPMASWRERMPIGMYLKSTPAASSIAAPHPGSTLQDFCAAMGEEPLVGHRPVPIDSFVRYGLWFQERHVSEVEPSTVVHVARRGRDFSVMLDDGEELITSSVVVASGLNCAALVPPVLAALRRERAGGGGSVSHSSEHRDLARFAGRRVAVIGAGQSALETAAILHESGATVELFARGPGVRFASAPADVTRQGLGTPLRPESPLGPGWSLVSFTRAPGAFRHLPPRVRLHLVATVLGPFGAWWLRDRVEGRIPIHVGHRLESAALDGSQVLLTFAAPAGERRTVMFDHAIAATGYRVHVDALNFLDAGMRREIARTDRAWPALDRSFGSSVPGLYFTGLAAAATFGPLMRFVCGTGFAARRLSAAVAQRQR